MQEGATPCSIHEGKRSIGKIFDHRFVGERGDDKASRGVGYTQQRRIHLLLPKFAAKAYRKTRDTLVWLGRSG